MNPVKFLMFALVIGVGAAHPQLGSLGIFAHARAPQELGSDTSVQPEPLAEPQEDRLSGDPQPADAPDAKAEVEGDAPVENKPVENKPVENKTKAELEIAELANPADEKVVDAQEPLAGDAVLQRTYQRAMLIDVRGAIFENLKQYMLNRLSAAQSGKVDLIILRITSPGGEMNASLELARKLSEINWATTVAFIPEEAYSGAAILALGCDRIYMRPRALIGDAGPIHFHGGLFEHADEKVVSALAVSMHQLAAAKKRPGAIAEAMVDRKLVVHEAHRKNTGERTFLTSTEIQQPRNQELYNIGAPIPESGQNRFLTVAGARAVELMIAEGTFDSERELLAALQVEALSETRRTWVDQVVFVLNRPLVSGLLLLIGLIGLYVEFAVPGISFAAFISLCCFALFFWSHALGGTSGWLEVMLFALGVGCLCVELFILPGFGLFGLTGVVMVVLSLVMASQDFLLPQSTVQWATLRNNLLIVLGAMAALIVALIVQVTFFDSIPGLGGIRLGAPEIDLGPAEAASGTLASGTVASSFGGHNALPQVGALGTADSVLRPAGKVRFLDQLVDVVTEGDFLDPGTDVEVVKREGNRVIVRRLS